MKEEVDITDFSTTIKKIHSIVEDNLILLTQSVEEIIVSDCKDENYIETTLDRLLDLCFDDKVLVLYKKLCRYYYKLNQEASTDYVKYYLDSYENENNGLPFDVKFPTKETQKTLNELNS